MKTNIQLQAISVPEFVLRSARGLRLAILVWIGLVAFAGAGVPEVDFPSEDFKRLDTFEAHVLNKADKAFRKKDFSLAAKEYDAFLVEFPRSEAIPYALLRKGRCLHKLNKRYAAVKEYQEVLDYFPNQVRYAAAALYYQGLCHKQNQDVEKALVAWKSIAQDTDYRKHSMAGRAFKELADAMMDQDKTSDAMKYYRMALVDFRQKIDHHDRKEAINRITRYHVRWNPDFEELAQLYVDMRGFHHRRPMKDNDVPEKPLEDKKFWNVALKMVKDYGDFDKFHESEERNYYKYWSKVMEDRFPEWDDFHLTRAKFALRVHGDIEKWYEQVDQVYANGLNEENRAERTAKWVRIYADHEAKAEEFLDKLDPKELDGKIAYGLINSLVDAGQSELAIKVYPWVNAEDLDWGEKRKLMQVLYQKLNDSDMAHNFFAKLKLAQADDKQKEAMANVLSRYDETLVMRCYEMMDDADRANYLRLKYYRNKEKVNDGLEIAPKVIESPDYASKGWWYKAELHDMARQWEQAINAYRQSDRQPESLFRIAEDYMRLGELDKAVTQLREIEKFFKDHRSEAAYKVAQYYKRASKGDQEIAALLHIMKKYPRSKESRNAHERLEDLNVDMRGGVDEAIKRN
ncbi:MAG: tetratricopeptide repeat protein [Verrucomicrobiota bacterium]